MAACACCRGRQQLELSPGQAPTNLLSIELKLLYYAIICDNVCLPVCVRYGGHGACSHVFDCKGHLCFPGEDYALILKLSHYVRSAHDQHNQRTWCWEIGASLLGPCMCLCCSPVIGPLHRLTRTHRNA